MDILIIGNGIAGVTAALTLRKQSNAKITIISGETEHFFARTALMYIYMGHMRYEDTKPYEDSFWQTNKINLLQAQVVQVLTDSRQVELADKSRISYEKLIIASGSTPTFYNWKGQQGEGVQGLYSYQDLQKLEHFSANIRNAVVVGGGLIGVELAEMLHSRGAKVYLLIREQSYWANVLPKEEADMVSQHILKHNIHLLPKIELQEIVRDEKSGRVQAIITNKGQDIACDWVGICTGVVPNVEWLRSQTSQHNILLQKGIVVNDFLQTSNPHIYAIGDCAEIAQPQQGRKAIEAVWYTARAMGETVAANILGQKIAYTPRLWFNSAKFFDIEYQVYGDVPAANASQQWASIFWQHKDREKSIRIVYNPANMQVLGFNLMGIRYRHEVCEAWILQKYELETVLTHLSMANFDPEFFVEYEGSLLQQYEAQTGKKLKLKQKRGLRAAWLFLKNKLNIR